MSARDARPTWWELFERHFFGAPFGLGALFVLGHLRAVQEVMADRSSWTSRAIVATAVAWVAVGRALRDPRVRRGAGVIVVASSGARRVDGAPRSADERRLVGVVEELAVAAQLPPPAVFVLEGEASINALSASRRPRDAAIAVTAGALTRLTRAELQALVAHELAHILQHDARIKSGMVLAHVALLRFFRAHPYGGLIGLTVRPVARWLAQRLVKRVSHERDLAADDTAVTLTRDPASLVRCLRKVCDDADRGRMRGAGSAWLRDLWFALADDVQTEDALAPPCPLEARAARLHALYRDAVAL